MVIGFYIGNKSEQSYAEIGGFNKDLIKDPSEISYY
jgi:hypothetical protein